MTMTKKPSKPIHTITGWYRDDELACLGRVAADVRRGKIYVEIGSHQGLSTETILRNTPKDAQLICIDYWPRQQDLDIFLANMKARNIIDRIFTIRRNSCTAGREWALHCGKQIAFLHIDAGHAREILYENLARFVPWMTDDAIIVGHDWGWDKGPEEIPLGLIDAMADHLILDTQRLSFAVWTARPSNYATMPKILRCTIKPQLVCGKKRSDGSADNDAATITLSSHSMMCCAEARERTVILGKLRMEPESKWPQDVTPRYGIGIKQESIKAWNEKRRIELAFFPRTSVVQLLDVRYEDGKAKVEVLAKAEWRQDSEWHSYAIDTYHARHHGCDEDIIAVTLDGETRLVGIAPSMRRGYVSLFTTTPHITFTLPEAWHLAPASIRT